MSSIIITFSLLIITYPEYAEYYVFLSLLNLELLKLKVEDILMFRVNSKVSGALSPSVLQ